MRKRFLSTLLAFCMILSLLPVTAFADEPAGGNVAKIGTTEYATLEAAIATAQEDASPNTITLLKDITNEDYQESSLVTIQLPAGDTLDGGGKTICGNVVVRVDSAGGTIQNINFANIHNNVAKGSYNNTTGKLSAIYAAGLSGTLTVTDCTFTDIDWDGLQITPKTGAVINIKDNTFNRTYTSSDAENFAGTIRYIHIEGDSSIRTQPNITVTITGNNFLNTELSGDTDGTYDINSIGIWYYDKACTSNWDLTGNYFSNINSTAIAYLAMSNQYQFNDELIFPVRTAQGETTPSYSPEAYKLNPVRSGTITYNYKQFYETLADAVQEANEASTATPIYFLSDITADSTIKINNTSGKIISFYMNGHTLTVNGATAVECTSEFRAYNGTITVTGDDSYAVDVSSTSNVMIGSTTSGYGTVNVNGSIRNAGSSTLYLAGGTVHGNLENTGSGSFSISSGTFDFEPDDSYLSTSASYVVQDNQDGTYTVRLMTDKEAVVLGYVCRSTAADSSLKRYFKSVTENWAYSASAYLITDVQEDMSYSSGTSARNLYTEGHSLSGTASTAKNLTIYTPETGTGIVNLSEVTCGASFYIRSYNTYPTVQLGEVSCTTFYTCGGNVTIDDLTCGTIYVDYDSKGSDVLLKNAEISTKISVYKATGKLTIQDGKYSAGTITNNGTLMISGGIYASKPDDSYLVSGASVIDNPDSATKDAYPYMVVTGVSGVTLDKQTASVAIGETLALNATVMPENATDRSVTWKSSAQDIAAVDENGLVTAKSAGEAVITVTTTDGGYTAACTVTVTEPEPDPTYYTVSFTSAYGTQYPDQTVEENKTVQLPEQSNTESYAFNGWKAPDDATYSAGSAYTITADTEFVAVWTEIPPETVTYTVTFDSNGGSAVSSVTVIDGEPLTVPTAPTRGGYDFGGWQYGGTLYQPGQTVAISANATFVAQWTEQPIAPTTMQVDFLVTPETVTAAIVVKDANGQTVTANEFGGYDVLLGETYTYTVSASGYVTKTGTFVPSTAEGGNLVTVTLTKQSSGSSSGGSSSGGSSSSSATTTTATNPDGSTTTTTTDKNTGTVTETTKNPDGSTTTVITAKDGASTETNTTAQGVTGTVVTDKTGEVTSVEAAIPAAVANTGETVTIPVTVAAADSADKAAVVEITVKGGGSASVEIPVTDVNPGLVAVVVNSNGTEEIVKTSVVTEDGVVLNVDGSAAVKVVDNTQQFIDVKTSDWFDGAVTFVAAREIMSGTKESMFSPDVDLTRSMMAQVLYSLENKPNAGADVFDDVASHAWYADAVNWAAEKKVVAGYSDGTFGPEDTITREQMAVILYGYARLKGADLRASAKVDAFRDGSRTSEWARGAMEWALTQGLLSGKGGNILDPQGAASRAEVAQVLANFCNLMAK